jgi:hypothetical protein
MGSQSCHTACNKLRQLTVSALVRLTKLLTEHCTKHPTRPPNNPVPRYFMLRRRMPLTCSAPELLPPIPWCRCLENRLEVEPAEGRRCG